MGNCKLRIIVCNYRRFFSLQVFKEIDDHKFKVPPQIYTVDSAGPSHPYHLVNVKTVMLNKSAREYAHPNERDLVVVETKWNSERCFAIVDSHRHNYLQGSNCEVLIALKMCCLPGVYRTEKKVELKVVMSLTNVIRQWTGLINVHTSSLVRDILNPRGKEYFCQPSLTKSSLRVSQVKFVHVLGYVCTVFSVRRSEIDLFLPSIVERLVLETGVNYASVRMR